MGIWAISVDTAGRLSAEGGPGSTLGGPRSGGGPAGLPAGGAPGSSGGPAVAAAGAFAEGDDAGDCVTGGAAAGLSGRGGSSGIRSGFGPRSGSPRIGFGDAALGPDAVGPWAVRADEGLTEGSARHGRGRADRRRRLHGRDRGIMRIGTQRDGSEVRQSTVECSAIRKGDGLRREGWLSGRDRGRGIGLRDAIRHWTTRSTGGRRNWGCCRVTRSNGLNPWIGPLGAARGHRRRGQDHRLCRDGRCGGLRRRASSAGCCLLRSRPSPGLGGSLPQAIFPRHSNPSVAYRAHCSDPGDRPSILGYPPRADLERG